MKNEYDLWRPPVGVKGRFPQRFHETPDPSWFEGNTFSNDVGLLGWPLQLSLITGGVIVSACLDV